MLICDREVSDEQIDRARELAGLYAGRGLNVLPSRPDAKRPMVRFKQYWDSPTPPDLIAQFPTSNLQVMAGRAISRLIVLDLDGHEAQEEWRRIRRGRFLPRTWMSRSGDNGMHIWFRIPEGYARPLPKGVIWKGDGEHSAIERLCDKSLVVAPPSIHPKTAAKYEFVARSSSPRGPLGECPDWILALEIIKTPPVIPKRVAPPPLPRRTAPGLRRYSLREVLDAILDKSAVASGWGVKFTGSVRDGWAECHAIDRPDNRPSAAVHQDSGYYVDLGSGVKLGFLDLGIALGQFHDLTDAVARLGDLHVR